LSLNSSVIPAEAGIKSIGKYFLFYFWILTISLPFFKCIVKSEI